MPEGRAVVVNAGTEIRWGHRALEGVRRQSHSDPHAVEGPPKVSASPVRPADKRAYGMATRQQSARAAVVAPVIDTESPGVFGSAAQIGLSSR
jgi:hypothetical protein